MTAQGATPQPFASALAVVAALRAPAQAGHTRVVLRGGDAAIDVDESIKPSLEKVAHPDGLAQALADITAALQAVLDQTDDVFPIISERYRTDRPAAHKPWTQLKADTATVLATPLILQRYAFHRSATSCGFHDVSWTLNKRVVDVPSQGAQDHGFVTLAFQRSQGRRRVPFPWSAWFGESTLPEPEEYELDQDDLDRLIAGLRKAREELQARATATVQPK